MYEKSMEYLFLILCMSTLSITTITTGSHPNVYPLVGGAHSQGYLGHVKHKRQGDQDAVCRAIITATESCTNGLLQEQTNIAQSCNELENARGFLDICRCNSMGTITCGAIDQFAIQGEVQRVCDRPTCHQSAWTSS